MKQIKTYIDGQIGLPILLTIGSMFAGSILWITNISAVSNKEDSAIRERVVKLETIIINTDKNVAEIKEDLREIKTALKVK